MHIFNHKDITSALVLANPSVHSTLLPTGFLRIWQAWNYAIEMSTNDPFGGIFTMTFKVPVNHFWSKILWRKIKRVASQDTIARGIVDFWKLFYTLTFPIMYSTIFLLHGMDSVFISLCRIFLHPILNFGVTPRFSNEFSILLPWNLHL